MREGRGNGVSDAARGVRRLYSARRRSTSTPGIKGAVHLSAIPELRYIDTEFFKTPGSCIQLSSQCSRQSQSLNACNSKISRSSGSRVSRIVEVAISSNSSVVSGELVDVEVIGDFGEGFILLTVRANPAAASSGKEP